MDIKDIALKVAKELPMEKRFSVEQICVECAEALVAEIQRQSEPIGWVHVDDVEYDGTTHSLRTINVMPSNFEKWVPIYVHPSDIEALEDKVAEACAYVADEMFNRAATGDEIGEAIRSGEWKNFRKGE